MKRLLSVSALAAFSLLAACGEDSTRDSNAADGGRDTPTRKSCTKTSECAAIQCTCKQQEINSYQGCSVVNGQGTCATCKEVCAEYGGEVVNVPGCLDSRDGTNSAFRGSHAIGDRCDKGALQSDCASGLCLNDGSGTGFCTKPCNSDGDCNGLRCKTFTVGDKGFAYCIAEAKAWCNR